MRDQIKEDIVVGLSEEGLIGRRDVIFDFVHLHFSETAWEHLKGLEAASNVVDAYKELDLQVELNDINRQKRKEELLRDVTKEESIIEKDPKL